MGQVETHLQVLDLRLPASLDEVKQAYKDLVSVWHPDRFAHNPRLQKKAEEKLKQFNQAYETLQQWYRRPPPTNPGRSPQPNDSPKRSAQNRTPRSTTSTPPPPRHRTGDLEITFADAAYILQRYCFAPLKLICPTQQEYQSGPFTLIVSEHPLEVTLAVPCRSLQHFDRILLSIPCKSTGHFCREEAQQLLQLLHTQG
ncbi:MAG: J domain-containing protein [Thermosynechococcaceae cyanobacterium]